MQLTIRSVDCKIRRALQENQSRPRTYIFHSLISTITSPETPPKKKQETNSLETHSKPTKTIQKTYFLHLHLSTNLPKPSKKPISSTTSPPPFFSNGGPLEEGQDVVQPLSVFQGHSRLKPPKKQVTKKNGLVKGKINPSTDMTSPRWAIWPSRQVGGRWDLRDLWGVLVFPVTRFLVIQSCVSWLLVVGKKMSKRSVKKNLRVGPKLL